MTKANKIKMVIRKIVREEVASAIKEVLVELKQPSLSSNPNGEINEQKKYTSNSVLNEILNETEGGIPQGETASYPTMGGETYDSSKVNEVMSSQYGDIMKNGVEPTPKSNADTIVGAAAPEGIKNLFNKDYSGILKKSIEKNNKGNR